MVPNYNTFDSIYEIEIYAHEQDLEVLMAEGDFGDTRLNHILLGLVQI